MKKMLFIALFIAAGITTVAQISCPPKNPNGSQGPPRGPRGGIPFESEVVLSNDPNEIIGPDGVREKKWVSIKDRLPYTILFENNKAATAAAKVVKVVYPVDPKQDMATLQLGSFGFNNLNFTIPPNRSSYYARLDVTDSLGLLVDITAGLDVVNHEIFWIFESLDPITQLAPADPLKGFLLVPDSLKPTSGHGYVNFTIKPVTTAITGDTITADADIIFDANEVIPTNIEVNTIDAVAPVSTLNNSAVFLDPTTFRISWRGQDDLHGSGVATYSVYVSVNGNPYTLYQSDIADTSLVFNALMGRTYCFFTTAKDSTGNEELLKNNCSLTVNVQPGTPLPVTWLYFNTIRRDNHAVLTWATATETNTRWFIVERSLDGVNYTGVATVQAAGNSTTVSTYAYTDSNITRLASKIIYYRLRQVDQNDRFTFSRVNLIHLDETLNEVLVNAYPNPFNQVITVQIVPTLQTDKTNVVELYSLFGTLLYRKEIGRQGATSIVLNDLPALPAGMYILKTTVNTKQYAIKLLKN